MFLPNKRIVVPKNEKAVRTARKTIEFLAPVIQRYHENALMPDGRTSLLYIPKTNGKQCTCCSIDILDDNGDMAGSDIQSILSNARQDFSISGYSSFTIDEDTIDDVETPYQPNTESVYTPSLGCNVCMGTNYVGGYNLHNGLRLVLDVREWQHDLIRNEDSPVSLSVNKNDTISTKVVLPKGVYRVDQFETRYGQNVLPTNLYIDGEPVDSNNIQLFCDGLEHTLTCVFTKEGRFTHFVLQVGFGQLLCDYSKVINTTQTDRFSQVGSFTIVLPPLIYSSLKGGIICDSTEGYSYRITESSRDSTFNGVITTTEAQARVVQPYELASELPALGTILKHGEPKKRGTLRRRWL